ncbi:MAG: flagellar biosynthesis protein FlaG [Gammaproteobacteria bacterium]|nr:flagellar protein FlaG [Gammaproteobacteria bacterium]PCH62690.1 MAG: flagellar biosynthesis protein FlaG [Gammaproteobacteria bacterium]
MANEIIAASTVVNRQITATSTTRPNSQAVTPIVPIVSSALANELAVNRSEEQGSVGQVDREAVNQAVQNLNDYVQKIDRNLEFAVDERSGNTVISVIDQETSEVIRQIPSEAVLNASKNLQRLEGLLLSAEA